MLYIGTFNRTGRNFFLLISVIEVASTTLSLYMQLPEELMFLKNRKAVQKHSDVDMHGKLCVLTGATSGVGLETL
jgi:hypothetical protein